MIWKMQYHQSSGGGEEKESDVRRGTSALPVEDLHTPGKHCEHHRFSGGGEEKKPQD